ncbi:DNA-directed RNA polymerase subunit alpha, partial [Patescibacteria group bacterium]|nr:DNA-directed RNA polymerase subunit alpha [Patescibacteria group bacterium]
MISLPLAPKILKEDKNKAVFQIEALYPGFGVTIANALRRVLLSSLPGCAVTEVKIKGVSHEFSTIDGVLEDVIIIIQNLKGLRFKIFEGESQTASLKVKGEKTVCGSDFKLPTQVKLANPSQHICTLTSSKADIEIDIVIERGMGYEPKDIRKKKKSDIGTMALDAIFTPIKSVSFEIENMRVGDRTNFDRVNLSIETDGTLTPEEAFLDACHILVDHFSLFLNALAPAKEEEKSKIEELDLSGRVADALSKGGIKTISGLSRKTEKALRELEGMGDA